MAASHNNQAFQLDVSREWNIKKEFLVRDHPVKEREKPVKTRYINQRKICYINGF
jgi:hypothetical protein